MQPALSSERWFVVRDEASGWFECSSVKIALREDVTNSCTGNLLFFDSIIGFEVRRGSENILLILWFFIFVLTKEESCASIIPIKQIGFVGNKNHCGININYNEKRR